MNNLNKSLIAILIAFAVNSNRGISQSSSSGISLRTWGIKINVTDIPKALRFYHDVLNFSINRISADSSTIFLRPATGDEDILLNKVPYLLPLGNNEAAATLTLQVNDLDSTINSLKRKGLDFGNSEIRKEGVGYAIYLNDPFGTRLSLLQETVVENPHFNEPRIYNYGFYVSDMDICRQFYAVQLGFPVRSQKYLPLDLPLNNPDGSFGFMLHTRNGIKPIHYNSADNQHIVVLFQSTNAEQLIKQMIGQKVLMANAEIQELQQGKTVSFYDPFGYISQVIEIRK